MIMIFLAVRISKTLNLEKNYFRIFMSLFYLMVTFVNSVGPTVMHLDAEARSIDFLNQVIFLTLKLYLKNSKGFGRQSIPMTRDSSFVLFLHLQFPSV